MERQSGNTGRLHRNPFGILKFTERPKTPVIKKPAILINMTSSEGNKLLAGAFHAVVDKGEADILQTAIKWNWK